MLGELPPAKAILGLDDLGKAIANLHGKECPTCRFKAVLREFFGVRHVELLSSGRAALTVVLKALAAIYGKSEIIIPDYTCFTVPSAVVKAGLRVAAVDVKAETLELDPDALSGAMTKETLAVVAVHPFGIPAEMEQIERISLDLGVPLIEDAAQAMGAKTGARRAGTFGTAAIISFGRGKPMTTINGGAILTDSDELAAAISEITSKEVEPEGFSTGYILQAIAYSILTRPTGFALAKHIPFFEVGVTRFDASYKIAGMSQVQATLGLASLPKLEKHNDIRRRNADHWAEILAGVNGLHLIMQKPGTDAVFLRQPVVFNSADVAKKIYNQLSRLKLGVAMTYPSCISDIPQLKDHPAGMNKAQSLSRELCGRVLTLPTHCMVTGRVIEKVAKVIIGFIEKSREEPSRYVSRKENV